VSGKDARLVFDKESTLKAVAESDLSELVNGVERDVVLVEFDSLIDE